jgi:diguanylate cyclase (GGDEF)-like protein
MLRQISFTHIFSAFCLLSLSLLGFCCYLLYTSQQTSWHANTLAKNHAEISSIINEIKYNSATLSELAKRYVLTGDKRYQDAYQQLMDFHNGRSPRPAHYTPGYWDLLEPTRSKRHPEGKALSISDRLLLQAFDNSERSLLNDFEEKARQLQGLERDAMRQAESVHDNSKWQTAAIRSQEIQSAIALLNSQAFLEAKHQAALPLDKLTESIRHRFHLANAELSAEQQALREALPYIIAFCLLLLLTGIALAFLHMLQYHKHLRDISLRDRITGLRNRHYALTFGEKLLAINRRNHLQCAVMLVTVDNFKQIRHQYGYEAGDIVLKTVSRLLARRARKSDIFAYYGGDEFVFVLGGIDSQNSFKFANMVCNMINTQPIELPQRSIICNARIGFAMSAQNLTLLDLLRRADQALKKARSKDQQPVCAYTPKVKPRRTDLRAVFQNGSAGAQTQN